MKQNYFEFFKLPVQFDLDLTDLQERHRAITHKVHPDRFVTASAAEQRMALQWSTFANQAFETLKHPVRRAQYLLDLAKVDLPRAQLPHDFLMQQMQWREALEEGAVEQVRTEALALNDSSLADLAQACRQQDWPTVQQCLAQSQFIENFMGQL